MAGELSFGPHSRAAARCMGKVMVAIGILAYFATGVITHYYSVPWGAVVAICAAVALVLGAHLWLGRRWLWVALLIDGVVIFSLTFSLDALLGAWSYVFMPIGIAFILGVAFWTPRKANGR